MAVAVHCDIKNCGRFSSTPDDDNFVEVHIGKRVFHFCGLEHAAGGIGSLLLEAQATAHEEHPHPH
jgi:hypothetical protein